MPLKPFYKRCTKCGAAFSTFDQSKTYCNDVCQCRDKIAKESREAGVNDKTPGAIKCRGCGIYFMRRKGENYCNQICWENEYTRKLKPKRVSIEKTCPECNCKFDTDLSVVKYCSKTCAQKVQLRSLEKLKAKKREENAKAGKKKRKIPYHILNMMAEKKRLDEEWDRLTR